VGWVVSRLAGARGPASGDDLEAAAAVQAVDLEVPTIHGEDRRYPLAFGDADAAATQRR
jgi:hypothetical protein